MRRGLSAAIVGAVGAVLLSCALVADTAQGQGAQTRPIPRIETVEELARTVEARASRTSFAELEAFAVQAASRRDEEGLSQGQHVVWILIKQHDFASAERWNAALKANAEAQRNQRYLALVEINASQVAHFRDRSITMDQMQALKARQTDWLPTVFAQIGVTRMLIDENRIGEAIQEMATAIALIPDDQAQVSSVGAAAWDSVSIAHMMVDDVPGYVKAISNVEAHIARSSYPRPEYESLFNLAQSLGFLGRHEEAATLVAAYRRLALRTNTPVSHAWAANLCAYDAITRDDWAEVLGCLETFEPHEDVPVIVATNMIAQRSTAYARAGNLPLARRDLETVRTRLAAGEAQMNGTIRRAEVEYLLASGDYENGVPQLRQYHLDRFLGASKAASAAMEQLVVGIDDQLHTANSQNQLKAEVIAAQRWLVGVLIVLIVAAAAMFWRQRQLTGQLARASQREKEVHEAKSAFFANMSHEIRTPLNGVVAMADALGRARLDDQAAHMVRIIASSGQTLERLLSDILDSAKMEAGQIEIEILPFSLGEAVREVETLWSQAAAKKGVAVRTQIDAATERWVMGDRIRLSQVLNNLVSNALKFTTEGEVVLTAEAIGQDRVRFIVADTGIGFSTEQKAKIFERFQQADGSITRRFGGTGLGLSICRQLVQLMGGDLDCDSVVGEGSRFWFEIDLPVAADDAVTQALPIDEEPAEAPSALKVLVADDNPSNRSILGLLLEFDNMDLSYAENGEEALNAATDGVFDVIFMDMQMPVMDGLTSTAAIRAAEIEAGRAPATIIILSANAGPEDQQAGRRAGADGHISKPVTLERLLEGVDLAMKQNRARQSV